jgi:hypothetical protein
MLSTPMSGAFALQIILLAVTGQIKKAVTSITPLRPAQVAPIVICQIQDVRLDLKQGLSLYAVVLECGNMASTADLERIMYFL